MGIPAWQITAISPFVLIHLLLCGRWVGSIKGICVMTLLAIVLVLGSVLVGPL
jgi:hypothetical protein